jgi:hypothetical protein
MSPPHADQGRRTPVRSPVSRARRRAVADHPSGMVGAAPCGARGSADSGGLWASALSSLLSVSCGGARHQSTKGSVVREGDRAPAVLFGFLPMLSATGPDPHGVLKSRGAAGRGASSVPFGRTLVVTQIAVSLVLLVAAGLFVRSLMRLKDVDLGFDPNQVVLFRVSPLADQQPIRRDGRLYRQLLERAVSVPALTVRARHSPACCRRNVAKRRHCGRVHATRRGRCGPS